MTIELQVVVSANGRHTLQRRDFEASWYADVVEPSGMLANLDVADFYRAAAKYIAALAGTGDQIIYRDVK